MNITNYIQERIEELHSKLKEAWVSTEYFCISEQISELQAVLSKIEELEDPTYKDEIVIPVYHHYRRKDGTAWHWTSESKEELGEIPKDAVEIPRGNMPEFPLQELNK